ncbi:MAG: trigger factor [Holophagaceae bacterium]|nr:trigger factor [Holophagaceae bacterium]
MQVTLLHNSDTRKSLEMVFPIASVESAFVDVIGSISSKVKIPGFRAGKVPKDILISKYKPQIERDVSEKLVDSHFWEAASSAGVQPISRPAIEKIDVVEGAEGKIKVQFDVAPVVKLPEYKGVTLTKKKRRVDDEAVDDALEAIRIDSAKLVPVEDEATFGHFVTFDVKIKPQGMKTRSYTDRQIHLAENKPFDAEFIGMKIDETKKFSIQTPENDANRSLAGKQVNYEVLIVDIRSKVLPNLDDEFAKDVDGNHENLQALRENLHKELEENAESEAMSRLQSYLLDNLLDASTFEVPASMVNLQIDDYCREFVELAARRGINHKQINWGAYRRHRLVDAERAVRSGYLLQALGNAEDIQVSEEEIDTEIRKWMEATNSPDTFETVKASLDKRGATTEIRGRIRTDKIFDLLLKTATISEELLDKAAYLDLLEMERRREEGVVQARFDAGGLDGGNFAEQDGGEPEAIVPVEEPGSDNIEPEVTSEEKIEEVQPTKRERNKADKPAEETTPTDTAQPKRSPKKQADVEETTPAKRREKNSETIEPEEAPPAKRGRPKKVASEPEVEVEVEKPKRGRKKSEE